MKKLPICLLLVLLSSCRPKDPFTQLNNARLPSDNQTKEIEAVSPSPTKFDLNVLTTHPGLTTFANLIETHQLTYILESGEFTVFAPNDTAFSALPEGELNQLMTDQTFATEFIKNHIIQEQLSLQKLSKKAAVISLSGESLTIQVDGEYVLISGASITTSDLNSDAVTVHIIDKTL